MSSSDDDILAVARDGYLEEARENLQQFEQALLAMETDPGNTEAVNTAFRAAHTIKGGAGMFGYELAPQFERVPVAKIDEFQLPPLAIGWYDVVVGGARGAGHGQPTRQAAEQRLAQTLFQVADVLADRRLGHMQFGGGTGQVQVAGRCLKGAQGVEGQVHGGRKG